MDAERNTEKRRSFKSLLWAALALLPFCWAVVAWAKGSTPAPPPEPPQRPSLVFHTYLIKRGRVSPRPMVGARFFFMNRGDQPVKIVEAKPSCGCLKPRLKKRVWQPGERGELILPVQTPNQQPGPHAYTLTVRYEDPEPRETVLTFEVELPEKQVMVSPPALAIYQLGTRETERTILVSDYPRLGLKLTGVTCNSEFATVRLGGTQTDEFGHARHEVLVKVPGQIPPGRHHSVITITTDDERYRKLKVPLYLIGRRPKTARGDRPFPRR